MAVTACFRLFGHAFAVESRSETAIRLFRGLYRAHEIAEPSEELPRFRMEASRDDNGRCWNIRRDDQPPTAWRSLGAALNRLEYEICVHLVAPRRGILALHGATILTDRGAAFITGLSGAGKTTLSLALTTRGYRLGGDDMAILDPQTSAIQPVPRCFHLDPRSRRLLRGLNTNLSSEGAKHGFVTPADLGVVNPSPIPIRWFIGLEAGDELSPCLTNYSQAEAIALLLRESPRGFYSHSEILPIFGHVAAAADCRRLVRGRLLDTVETVSALIGAP